VLNLAGRPVRVIGRDSLCEAGQKTLVWNAASDAGLRVPDGLYLVEVTARDDGGGLTRALTQVRVSR
jgi:flagellar hook assembly protein FlgD